jgi:hypothetical protein
VRARVSSPFAPIFGRFCRLCRGTTVLRAEDTGPVLHGFVGRMPFGAGSLGDSQIHTLGLLIITPSLLDKWVRDISDESDESI